MECIVTSFLDKNYYVINANDPEIFYLVTILSETEEKSIYANTLLNFWSETRKNKKNLFVDKDTTFGHTLTELISKNKLIDENTMLRKHKIINALIQINLTENYDTELQKIVSTLIKKKIDNKNIENLNQDYNVDILKKIIFLGMKPQEYLPKVNPTLTGFETEGYLCDEDLELYYFNVSKKVCTSLKEKVKTKNTN